MKKGRVINFSASRFMEFLSENKSLIALIFSLILGILVAVTSIKNNEFSNKLCDTLFAFYKSEHFSLSFGMVFYKSLLFGLTYLCLAFVFGTTMLGIIFLPILNFAFGIYFGCVSSYICDAFSFIGVAFNAVVLIPGSIILSVALVFAAKESMQFSFSVAKTTFSSATFNDLPIRFKGICIKYIILIVAVVFSALADAFFTTTLSKIFNF